MKYRIYLNFVFITALFINSLCPITAFGNVDNGTFTLPKPGSMVFLSPAYAPPILKGLKIHPQNPLQFEFILSIGDQSKNNQNFLKEEGKKLIQYFLAGITIPEDELWVNLSPYEKGRIIPHSFGLTLLGRDLLAEDYMLKQITASLIYPEKRIGKAFWSKVYAQALKKYHTTNIPINTFNKVWIIPKKARIYESTQAAYIVDAKLKVMLDADYLSLKKHEEKQSTLTSANNTQFNEESMRAIILPALEKEVNEGKNFAVLRQIYNSLILAAWYKKKIKASIINHSYANKHKIIGITYHNSVIPLKTPSSHLKSPSLLMNDAENIYQQYLSAFKKGVFNYIKEETDPLSQESIPKKYFSGGAIFSKTNMNVALEGTTAIGILPIEPSLDLVLKTNFRPITRKLYPQNSWAMIAPNASLEISRYKLIYEKNRNDQTLGSHLKTILGDLGYLDREKFLKGNSSIRFMNIKQTTPVELWHTFTADVQSNPDFYDPNKTLERLGQEPLTEDVFSTDYSEETTSILQTDYTHVYQYIALIEIARNQQVELKPTQNEPKVKPKSIDPLSIKGMKNTNFEYTLMPANQAKEKMNEGHIRGILDNLFKDPYELGRIILDSFDPGNFPRIKELAIVNARFSEAPFWIPKGGKTSQNKKPSHNTLDYRNGIQIIFPNHWKVLITPINTASVQIKFDQNTISDPERIEIARKIGETLSKVLSQELQHIGTAEASHAHLPTTSVEIKSPSDVIASLDEVPVFFKQKIKEKLITIEDLDESNLSKQLAYACDGLLGNDRQMQLLLKTTTTRFLNTTERFKNWVKFVKYIKEKRNLFNQEEIIPLVYHAIYTNADRTTTEDQDLVEDKKATLLALIRMAETDHSAAQTSSPGGIDFGPVKNILIQNKLSQANNQLDYKMLQKIQQAAGLEPLIVSIQDLGDLRSFLLK